MKHFVFIDGNGQVQAVQSSPNAPAETRWESDGLTRVEVRAADIKDINRDKKVTVSGGEVDKISASVNAVQPTPDPGKVRQAEIAVKIKDGSVTLLELIEYTKLRDGIS